MSVKETAKKFTALCARQDKLTHRASEISEERKALGYEAYANEDTKARSKLDALNHESATLAGELEALNAAIDEAQRRFDAATQAEATATERERARELKKICSQFLALAQQADEQATAFMTTCQELEKVGAMNAQGLPPTGQQRLSYFSRAVFTSLMGCPWRRTGDFPHLPHNERRTFTDPAQEWVTGALRVIEQKIGEDTDAAA
jgi:predicted RNase H-like nuclease (RuvC/YqgF family)